MRKLIVTGLALSAACLSAGSALAQSDEDKIEYRQAVFTVIGGNFGPMGDMVEGKSDYDPEIFTRNAERVAQMSQMALEGFEGGPHTGDTDAKDAIWDQWEKYQKGNDRFQSAAQELAEASSDEASLDEVREPFMEVAESCKNCHDNFRDD